MSVMRYILYYLALIILLWLVYTKSKITTSNMIVFIMSGINICDIIFLTIYKYILKVVSDHYRQAILNMIFNGKDRFLMDVFIQFLIGIIVDSTIWQMCTVLSILICRLLYISRHTLNLQDVICPHPPAAA